MRRSQERAFETRLLKRLPSCTKKELKKTINKGKQ